MRYVVFDIETTGLDTWNDRIVEIGAVKVEDGQVIEEFDMLINPGIPMPPNVSAINNTYDDMLVTAENPGVVLYQFYQFVKDVDFLVGQNARRFDYPFLESEFDRHFIKFEPFKVKDTIYEARRTIKGLRSYSLAALCRVFQVTNESAHRALSDARVTQIIFEKIQQRKQTTS